MLLKTENEKYFMKINQKACYVSLETNKKKLFEHSIWVQIGILCRNMYESILYT